MNRRLIIFLIPIVILGVNLGAFQMHKTITVEIDGESQTLSFWGFRVRDALVAGGIPMTGGDMVTPALEASIPEGGRVRIDRAFWVVITADGESRSLWTTEREPARLVEMAGIDLETGDQFLSSGTLIDPRQLLPRSPSHSLQIRRATQILLNDQGEELALRSTAATLGEALSEAGTRLFEADQLIPPADTLLTGQPLSAKIERSRAVSIQTQNETVQTRVLASTVGEALTEAGMALQGLDYSLPAADEPISEDGHIRIVRVREEVLLEQTPIPFGLEYQALPEADLDTQQVVHVGEYGMTARRVRVIYEDGEEVDRNVEDEWLAKNPKPRIVGYGTRITIQTAQTPDGPIEYWRKVDVYATSYSPCNIGVPGQCGSYTASGKVPQKGMIAVIRSWYNMMQGLPVYVTSYGFATIEDLGAGVTGQHWIDLAYSDDEYKGWSGHVTLYFLTPVPENVMWMLK